MNDLCLVEFAEQPELAYDEWQPLYYEKHSTDDETVALLNLLYFLNSEYRGFFDYEKFSTFRIRLRADELSTTCAESRFSLATDSPPGGYGAPCAPFLGSEIEVYVFLDWTRT